MTKPIEILQSAIKNLASLCKTHEKNLFGFKVADEFCP